MRQHAYQPVAWLPFEESIFAQAQEKDCPLFVSIGYSACHWCHVMARESFEDEEIAAILNESFLPIKIDREEHPEIDTVYLLACEILRGHAGWPLTILALPDGWPFFVATYLPKEGDGYRLGLKELLLSVLKAWNSNRIQILESAREIKRALEAISFLNPGTFEREEILKRAFEELFAQFDPQYRGFGRAAKFPLPLKLLYLLRFGKRYETSEALKIVKQTLFKMRFSGLFDQVGFGFHRYTIDRAWRMPHFEKMLYDQGLLLYLYAEAAKLFLEPLYERVVREIVIYLQENLWDSPSGLFYSAESAESEGQEGLFYTWSLDELKEVLDLEELKILKSYFDLRPEGNYLEEGSGKPSGRNILFPLYSEEFERPLDLSVEPILQKLKAFRKKRPRPPRDEKFLTDWNALTIAGLAHAGKILGEKDFILIAESTFKSLWQKGFWQGRLLHLLDSSLKAFLEDYVFLAWAALELFEATSNSSYFEKITFLFEEIEKLFKTPEGLYQQIGNDQKTFLIKFFPIFEGAIPSGNGLLAYLLARVGRRFSASQEILTNVGKYLQERPGDFPSFLLALCH